MGKWKTMISFFIPVFSFIALALLIFFQPHGFWSLSYLKNNINFLLLLSSAWTAFYFINRKIRLIDYQNFRKINHIKYETGLYFIISAAFAGFLYIFRTGRFLPPPHGNGDSLLLLEHIPVYAELFGYLDSFDEILTLFIHSKMYLVMEYLFNSSVLTSISLTSSLAGFIYFFFFLKFVKNSGKSFFYAFSLIILTPAVELFAGYIENYFFVTVIISLTYFQGILLLEKNKPLYRTQNSLFHEKEMMLISVLSSFAFLFHILSGVMIFSLIYLVWARTKELKSFIKLSIFSVLPAALVIGFFWSYFVFFAENPLSITESFMLKPPFLGPEKILSAATVRNFLSCLFLASPFAVPLFIYIVSAKAGIAHSENDFSKSSMRKAADFFQSHFTIKPVHVFLLTGSISFIIPVFVINPLIGFPADWDLLTHFHIPLNLYLLYLITEPSLEFNKFQRRNIIAAAFIFNLYATFFWILYNSSSSKESRNNIVHAERNTEQLLAFIKNDLIFNKINTLPRKKTYVKVKLFEIRSENFAVDYLKFSSADLSSEKKEEIQQTMQMLHKNTDEFSSIILLPEEEFRKKLPPIWKNLSEVNSALSKLQNTVN